MQVSDITDLRSPVPTSAVSRPRTIRALTSIRFFAAFGVALYHMIKPPARFGFLASVVGAGYVGVSFFFLLSGFILTYSHAREYELGLGRATQFWIARFARVYPVYLVVMLFAAYVHRDQFHPAVHAIAYAADLLMIQAWFTRLVIFFNLPAWSLSVEAFFYAVFPFLVLRLRPSSRLKAMLQLVAWWTLALLIPLVYWHFYPAAFWLKDGGPTVGTEQLLLVRFLPLYALPEFLAGIALGWLYLRFDPGPRRANLLATTSLILLTATLFASEHIPLLLLNNGLLIPVFALLILSLCHHSWLSRLLAHPALVLLGESSFAFYLIHLLFNDWTKVYFGPGESLAATTLKLAIITLLSIALHLTVERPCRRLILAWWRTHHPAPPRSSQSQVPA